MNNKFKVTVIVPIYNSEDYLARCLDSLVYQTLEDLEVLCINNGSTDGSESILKKYHATFPNRVFYKTIEHSDFIGRGRNIAIEIANGEYIGFCDSDDMVNLDYYENLYKKAIEKQSDLVFAPLYYCSDGNVSVAHEINGEINIDKLLIYGNVSTWNKLYKTSFLRSVEKQPEDFCFEDFAWYVALVTKAKKVDYCPIPGYYYIIRNNSESKAFNKEKIYGLVKACVFSEKHCSKKHINLVRITNIKRIVNALDQKWQLYDEFVEYIDRTLQKVPKNYFISMDSTTYDIAKRCVASVSNKMPQTIYISKFANMNSVLDFNEYLNGWNIVWLDESNCDIKENIFVESAYANGMYDDVAEYFALKRIFEHGGIYLSRELKVDADLKYLCHLDCFFSKLNEDQFYGGAFGAKKGNKLICGLLKTYYTVPIIDERAHILLKDRIKFVIENRIGSIKNENNHVLINDKKGLNCYIFKPAAFIYDVPKITNRYMPNFHFAHIELNVGANRIDGILADMLGDIIDVKSQAGLCQHINTNKINQLTEQLNAIKMSKSYKLAIKLKNLSNKVPFRWLKKSIIKFMQL